MMAVDDHRNRGLGQGRLDRLDEATQRHQQIPFDVTEGMLVLLTAINQTEFGAAGTPQGFHESWLNFQTVLGRWERKAHGRTVTGVPASTLRKKVAAMWVGILTQPWDAAKPGR